MRNNAKTGSFHPIVGRNDPVLRKRHAGNRKFIATFTSIMRRELASQEGQRKKFKAIFTRLGKKTSYQGYPEETILLNNVADAETGKIVTSHLWFTYTKGFQEARITPGDTIEFEARVKEYRKGYVNKQYGINNSKQDYKLSHPTKIKVVETKV